MRHPVDSDDLFALVRPGIDAHTLGISRVHQLLQECGVAAVVADADICEALNFPSDAQCIARVDHWLRQSRITRLGFSYRLDVDDALRLFCEWLSRFHDRGLLAESGGPLRRVYFAGLPGACQRVGERFAGQVEVFLGDETASETLGKLGIPCARWPRLLSESLGYDESRLQFGTDLVRQGRYVDVKPPDRSGYPAFGSRRDSMIERLGHARRLGQPPLIRAHVGPYLPDREEAVRLFLRWGRELAADGFLDVLSVGTSQLTQSDFGGDWGTRPNGGGVPIHSPEEYLAVWKATRPMLVRTYAGTRRIPELAQRHEQLLNIAWHALSLWWFCQLDGRGPYSLRENLHQHLDALRVIAESQKPFEPNVPHHFAFRGADDASYVASGVLAARVAKRWGIRHLVVQNMLNTPKSAWGIQDLAKARAMLQLIRELEDSAFRVYYQPRAGLDCFSHDLLKARAQLAAVTALMADVEPRNLHSPDIVHVVSFSEGAFLADPAVVKESVQLTLAAFQEYRRLQARGLVEDMVRHPEVAHRQQELVRDARHLLRTMESAIPEPYGADGLYLAFKSGFFPVPHLWTCREEFDAAVSWRTRPIRGAVRVVDDSGHPVPVEARAAVAAENARRELALSRRRRLSA